MFYARWTKEKEIKEVLSEIKIDGKVKQSGIPLLNKGNSLYLSNSEAHSLVIGSTGSGKTQTTILPLTKLSLLALESVVINDVMGEIYKKTAHNFLQAGYDVIVLDFNKPHLGNSWNPFSLAYEFYKNGDKDSSIRLVEELGYYLFNETTLDNTDSFWINSCIDYFTGITLYLFDNAKSEEINLNSVYSLANELLDETKAKKFMDNINKNSTIYYNVTGTLMAPLETRGGIISTFNQKLKRFVGLDSLCNMLAGSDFDIKNISNKKTALFIISGFSDCGSSLIPLFVSQVIYAVDKFGKKDKLLNIILDEFDTMLPINNFAKLINYSRSIRVRFTVVIKSYIDLVNIYGKEQTEIIKSCFPIIIYLLARDIYTLEEVSRMCGNHESSKGIEPLISVEELKVLKAFESIILMPRLMPFRTKLVPDYQISWYFEEKEIDIQPRKENNISIYSFDLGK